MKLTDRSTHFSFPITLQTCPAWLVSIRVTRERLVAALGEPSESLAVEGSTQKELWGRSYDCGLKVVVQLDLESGIVRSFSDPPEQNHLLRHLPFPANQLSSTEPTPVSEELSTLLQVQDTESPQQEVLGYQVWRQGTDGNAFPVGQPTSERDAACWVKHFESLGHHQHYCTAGGECCRLSATCHHTLNGDSKNEAGQHSPAEQPPVPAPHPFFRSQQQDQDSGPVSNHGDDTQTQRQTAIQHHA